MTDPSSRRGNEQEGGEEGEEAAVFGTLGTGVALSQLNISSRQFPPPLLTTPYECVLVGLIGRAAKYDTIPY